MDGFKTRKLIDGKYHSVAREYNLRLVDGTFYRGDKKWRQPRRRSYLKKLYKIADSLTHGEWVKIENHYMGGEEHLLIHRSDGETCNLFYLLDRF